MENKKQADLAVILRKNGFPDFPEKQEGFDVFITVITRIIQDGAVFVLKIDGERAWPKEGESPPITVIISKGRLINDYIHVEADTIDSGMRIALMKYFAKPPGE